MINVTRVFPRKNFQTIYFFLGIQVSIDLIVIGEPVYQHPLGFYQKNINDYQILYENKNGYPFDIIDQLFHVIISGNSVKMGLGSEAIKLYLELYQRGFFQNINSVMDIGSQEIHMQQSDFEQLIISSGIPHYDRGNFTPWNWPSYPRCSSKPFFEMLGVKRYASIDVNGDYGAIPLDLNYPLEQREHYHQYDLVTDHGACEHVFNIAEAYRTMHRLCKTNGIMVISQMVLNTNGYYLFDSSFFEGISAANNYRILYSAYIVSLHSQSDAGTPNQYQIPLSRELLDVIDYSKVSAIGITYVLQKQSDADFQYPYQGFLLSNNQGHYGFSLQFLPLPPSRTYLPIRDDPLDQVPIKYLAAALYKRMYKKEYTRTVIKKIVTKISSFFQ